MNRIELVDCHTHTTYSDGKSQLEDNIVAAIARGCTTIACTDHLARPDYMDCFIPEERVPDLEGEIIQARLAHPEIDIVYGFEADWYPGCEKDIAETRGNATFLLGSIHYLGELTIDWDQDMRIWEQEGADAVWRRYAQDWCEACSCPIKFDSMAHPDLPRLFSLDGYAPTINLEPLWDNMAEAAKAAGVRVELSTAGLRKKIKDFYPERGLLERFFEAGIPITVGSDAHLATDVASGMEQAYALAHEIGYRRIEVPTSDGGWRHIEI